MNISSIKVFDSTRVASCFDDDVLFLVLDLVTSTPKCIGQPRPRVYLMEGTYHNVHIRGCLEGLALMI